jgi:hypothetical protein
LLYLMVHITNQIEWSWQKIDRVWRGIPATNRCWFAPGDHPPVATRCTCDHTPLAGKRVYPQLRVSAARCQSLLDRHPFKQGVCHRVALPLTLKNILRQKKNYENSNVSPWKNIIFKKILQNRPKSFKIL